MKFQTRNPQYEYLRKKWIGKHKTSSENFLSNHSSILRKAAIGGLGGLMLLTTPGLGVNAQLTDNYDNQQGVTKGEDKNALLAEALKTEIPNEMRTLTPEEESKIGTTISDYLGINAKAEINGIKLNRSYGLIGGEQHLYRYPGDNLLKHADNAVDYVMYIPAGIAPGLGAWGYFAPSQVTFTETEKQQEKYYLAVQTFLIPGYAENVKKYSDFFKFRKMVVVNPKTGQSVVAVIGDAGPAEWTGKHLGGSPEIMQSIGLANGPRKGAVLYFFVADPENKIPLGPININKKREN